MIFTSITSQRRSQGRLQSNGIDHEREPYSVNKVRGNDLIEVGKVLVGKIPRLLVLFPSFT